LIRKNLKKFKIFCLILVVDSANTKIIVMKTTILAAFVSLTVLAFTSCAPVQIYSNKNLTEKSGLKYYTVKPFLQVERDAETNRIIKATVIYLPDLANPQYMLIRDGFNSRKLNLKFTDGTISTFGYSSTGKVGESVDALAALISKGTDALTELNTLRGLQAAKPSSNNVELYEILIESDKTILREVTIAKE
jgi:hypothetical protein